MPQYYMFYKPRGYLTAKTDAWRPTMMEFFPQELRSRLHPVGRLDKDSEGLLLVTDDGMLDNALLQPSRHVPKKYAFQAFGVLTPAQVAQLEAGVPLPGKETVMTKPARAQLLPPSTIGACAKDLPAQRREHFLKNPDRPVCRGLIWIREGRKHQVRLMLKAVGCHVFWLKRLAIGSLELDPALAPGDYRSLTAEEVARLFSDGRTGASV